MSEWYSFRCVAWFFSLSSAPNCYVLAASNSIKIQIICGEVVVLCLVLLFFLYDTVLSTQ